MDPAGTSGEAGSVTVHEAIQRELVPESGARILQMTSGDAIYDAIYSETSYADPSSRYFIFDKVCTPARPSAKYGGATCWIDP